MPLPHWIWLTCIYSRIWQCVILRLGSKRHCSFVFFVLGSFTLGKSAAISRGNASSPMKMSTWEGTQASANSQHQCASHESEPPCNKPSSPTQAFGDYRPGWCLITNSGDTSSQNLLHKLPLHSWPQKLYDIISIYCCFKPVSFVFVLCSNRLKQAL